MAATTPTPDARRVRRWLSRALAVSGGAAAATAILWGIGATSASAVENPLGDAGDADPAAAVPFDSESDDSRSSGPHSPQQRPTGGADHGAADCDGADHDGADAPRAAAPVEAGAADGESQSAGHAAGRQLADGGRDATGLGTCDDSAGGPTDLRGLFDGKHADRFDAGELDSSKLDSSSLDSSKLDSSSLDSSELDSGSLDSGELGAVGDDVPGPDPAGETVAAELAEGDDVAGGTCPDAEPDRPGSSGGTETADGHGASGIVDPTRDALHDFGDTLDALTGFDDLSGDRSVNWTPDWQPEWSGFDLPWDDFTADPADLPSPYDVPMGSGAQAPESRPQTSAYDADTRASGRERQQPVPSTSDHGHPMTPGVFDAGSDGVSIEGSAVGTEPGQPATLPAPEFDPQYVPASVPSHSSIAGNAHADAPSGAVITTARPFAVAAAGAVTRSGLLHKSMSPGSQPGVTPD
ncbi:hypothetical protein GCM10009676_41520 [Prauserella halophila]|uniref:Pentapeptide repeat protein n=1 Tax=Prauserella halophila TaxID=185641 RepID=A0ABP4H586_9PSEU|nr:hypothetical protein [Prauserella halophila]MCP2236694.1 hypothetical protein [Prauserella halophila]